KAGAGTVENECVNQRSKSGVEFLRRRRLVPPSKPSIVIARGTRDRQEADQELEGREAEIGPRPVGGDHRVIVEPVKNLCRPDRVPFPRAPANRQPRVAKKVERLLLPSTSRLGLHSPQSASR